MVREKIRIRFSKTGDLRLISHHDLMRCFERMLRRASIPYRSTAGYNPKPRLIFALSLPLGISGAEEVVELELNEELSADDIRERLAQQAPPGLEILSARLIEPKTTAHVQSIRYRIAVAGDRCEGLHEKIDALLASSECWIERQRPRPRKIDVRPCLLDLRLVAEALEIDIAVTPNGTARPDEILDLLGVCDLLEAGAILERIKMELVDECAAPPCPAIASSVEGHES